VATPWRRVQTKQVFHGEDGDAGRVQAEEFDAESFAAGDLESAMFVHTTRYRLHDVGQPLAASKHTMKGQFRSEEKIAQISDYANYDRQW